MKKSAIKALLVTAIIAGLLITTLVQLGGSSLIPYDASNMTVTGVLATDTYVLYPYTAQNLVWGFSKYGELINGAAKQGLEYNGMDVFCNPNVLEKDWSQGWYIDIHYADLSNSYQHAWAYALYSDISGGTGIGGDWKENVQNGPLGTPYGGRKTNVWATTDPITVLYDGPRSFVAQCRTTLYGASDHSVANSGLVNITITFVFNKVKKEIIEYKDVKRLDQGKFGRDFQVEFSNRGEWDIGTTSAPPSYARIYSGLSTVYDYNYQPYYSATHDADTYDVLQVLDKSGTYAGYVAYWPSPFGFIVKPTAVITRTEVLSSLCTVEQNVTWSQIAKTSPYAFNFTAQNWPTTDTFPIGGGIWSNEPMIFKNNILLFSPGDYAWNAATQTVTFELAPASTDRFVVDYKHHQPDNAPASYNMGYWSPEPGTPYAIGEWDFKLTPQATAQQFRGVCVYGLTDRHDGDDYDAYHGLNTESWSDGVNVIDREIMYQLDEVFNPWDLHEAVDKELTRWVEYSDDPIGSEVFLTKYTPTLVVPTSEWDQYGVFSERVEDLTNDTVYNRYLGEYTFTANANGTATFSGLDPDHYYKFLYSTYPEVESSYLGRYELGVVGRNAASVDSAGLSMITAGFLDSWIYYGIAAADMYDPQVANQMPWVMSRIGAGTAWTDYYYSTTDPRTALRDDWCTTFPVSSANLVGSGGPLANMLAYYGNDFMTAFFGLSDFTTFAKWKNAIAPVSCWNASSVGYVNSADLKTGYAVISTYIDINGTEILLLWGNWGRETYYVAKWFWEEGIWALQEAPHGITSIVVKITYKSYPEGYKPTSISVVESLGTISERLWDDWGGIHPDP